MKAEKLLLRKIEEQTVQEISPTQIAIKLTLEHTTRRTITDRAPEMFIEILQVAKQIGQPVQRETAMLTTAQHEHILVRREQQHEEQLLQHEKLQQIVHR